MCIVIRIVCAQQKQMATTQTNVKEKLDDAPLVSCWPPPSGGQAGGEGVHGDPTAHSRSHEELTDARARMRSLAATSLSLRPFTSSASAAYATAALCAPP